MDRTKDHKADHGSERSTARGTSPNTERAQKVTADAGRRERFGAALIALGAVTFGVASAFHPLTLDPNDPSYPLEVGGTARWVIVHVALMIAAFLLYVGLMAFDHFLRKSAGESRARFAPYALIAAIASFSLWESAFVIESTGWVSLARSPSVAAAPSDMLAAVVWQPTFALAYVASFLTGAAVIFWSLELLRQAGDAPFSRSRWMGWLGVFGGFYTAVTMPLAWSFPDLALWLILPIGGLLGVWLLAVSLLLWRGGDVA